MATNREIIIALDNFRLEKRKTIQDMTEGIISPRNYSRLLKDEAEITMDVLVALLDKLNTPFEEFVCYINMHKDVDSFEEDRFVYLVIFENYDKAVSKYSDVMSSKDNKSRFAQKTIPACVAYLSYVNKKITLQAAKMLIEGFLDLNTIKKNKVIHEEDIYTMYLYMKIANDDELNELEEFMNVILYDSSFKIFAHQYENTLMMAYIIEMYLLYNKPFSLENDKAMVEYFIPKLCNVDMVNALPGVNPVNEDSVGATGKFEMDRSTLSEGLNDFITKVPTDLDIVLKTR